MAVADLDGDGEGLEMVFGDAAGVVACVKQDGSECWRRPLPGVCLAVVLVALFFSIFFCCRCSLVSGLCHHVWECLGGG